MYPLIQLKKAAPVFLVALVCFGLLPTTQAVTPAPDGGYPNNTTAEGHDALFNLTTGTDNTALGFEALYHDTTGGYNTATGRAALFNNNGINNTANGAGALYTNTSGHDNTATGKDALHKNTTGTENTATGLQALYSNTTGHYNTATGASALYSNISGNYNTATGDSALFYNTIGNSNIAVGVSAGVNLTTGSNNIDIGNAGVAGESNKIRVGTVGTQTATFIAGISGVAVTGTAVVVNSGGQLGVAPSSERFKEAIRPMDKASEAILALKPVTFRYKMEAIDPQRIPQFGLVAEDVEQVNPDLVVRDKEGKPYSVRYDQVNVMLLNEFLKEHRTVKEQETTISQLEISVAKQQANASQEENEIQSLSTSLDEQASQIEKVSAQLETSKPAPQVVNNP